MNTSGRICSENFNLPLHSSIKTPHCRLVWYIYIFTSGILYLILLLTSYTHVIFILLANNLTHSSTWNYICTCKLWHVLHHWSFQHEQKLPPDFFRQDAEFFFFYLYIHVYIYMFIYTYLFCFWKRKMKKKTVSVENTKW